MLTLPLLGRGLPCFSFLLPFPFGLLLLLLLLVLPAGLFLSAVLLPVAPLRLLLAALFLPLFLLGLPLDLRFLPFVGQPTVLFVLLLLDGSLPQVRHVLLVGLVHFVLIGEAAEEPAADARDLGGVQHHFLFLGHADRDRFEVPEERGAAKLAAARAEPADHARDVAHADLAHLDPALELEGKVLHQFPEIDAVLGKEEEGDARRVEGIFDPDELHRPVRAR